ncbi:GTP cyclohydrolase 1 [Saxophila tyrrhenica]|uniref:GTP cyclohydrolase 1 n=1 Tax=Saxophila tyrrhenica TaxID=1690608 RepID=A0AAV9P686_9PEZI|nr:GTP cyclohydrolase 1 [Saxophila tyrrhenica]
MASVGGAGVRSSKRKHQETKVEKLKTDTSSAMPVPFTGNSAPPLYSVEIRHGPGKTAHDLDNQPALKKPKLPLAAELDGFGLQSNATRSLTAEEPKLVACRLDRMRGAVRTLLECIGEDPDREGLQDTPSRYANALLFLTSGHQMNVDTIVNKALFHESHHGMVIMRDIEICSLCEHHLLPFTGKMHIGYVPSSAVIGLSKLPRIAEIFSRRLQIQERLTKEVAHAIMEAVKPQGVAVVMEASHLCISMRGVQKPGTITITSHFSGCLEQSDLRSEFLGLVGMSRA